MELQQAIDLINTALFARWGKYLSDAELAIVRGAWNGQTYSAIADSSGYSLSYLSTDIGPVLWRNLSAALGERVSKTNFQSALERYRANQSASAAAAAPVGAAPAPPNPLPAAPSPICDWGEAVDVRHFFGRSHELDTLTRWIVEDQCRLVAILGMGGVGKTSLAAKLARSVTEPRRDSMMAYWSDDVNRSTTLQHPNTPTPQHSFQSIIWRSLRNAPPLETLLSELVLFLSDQADTQADLGRLLHWLRARRCLVVLDNWETLLQPGDRAGNYREGYEDYGALLQTVGEASHESCLIFTSREKPVEMAQLEGEDLAVRSLMLGGSMEVGQALLQAKGLAGTDEQLQFLCDRYSSNPLALKIVATLVQDLFEGDVADFIAQDTFLFNGVRRLLEQQFERLSYLEQSVMYWLAINREWTSIAELEEDIIPAISRASLMESLESLCWRNLIEKRAGSYTQQPVVMEYVSDRLIEKIATELITGNIIFFDRYALLKTTVKDYIRESQNRLILGSITKAFIHSFSSLAAQEQQILRLLRSLRHSDVKFLGYGVGNLINLCIYLNIKLSGFDFSGLTIRHAHLQETYLQRVSFVNAHFEKCTFTQISSTIFSVAFSPDGTLLVSSDSSGDIRLWRVADGQPLAVFKEHSDWVRSVVFCPQRSLLISCSDDHTIRFWDLDSEHCVRSLEHYGSRVLMVAASPDGRWVASGGEDCLLKLWDIETGELAKVLEGHDQSICAIAWSPDSRKVATGSHDQTIKLWDISTGACINTLADHDDWIRSVAFSSDGQQLASGSYDKTIKLWDVNTGNCLSTLNGHSDWVLCVAFSSQKNLLISSSEDHTIRIWDLNTGSCLHTLVGHQARVWCVSFSPDGLTFASGSEDQTIKLWSLTSSGCLKTLKGYTQQVWGLGFSPDGQMLASSGDEKKVLSDLWLKWYRRLQNDA